LDCPSIAYFNMGILMNYSNRNNLTNTTLSNNTYGVQLLSSGNNSLTGLVIQNSSSYGLTCNYGSTGYFSNNTLVNS
jgi:parallel beta-helix repeat protein